MIGLVGAFWTKCYKGKGLVVGGEVGYQTVLQQIHFR